ncbi:MBL fold metallo-hydrolase [Pseudooceanicola sp.]|uniref:MBL fold metallo-hydrolase n=1 Tax=Pseudooceanicola sp. TaxID=1914328 RepID=UPI002618A2B8|nr:MBL fold metallo-hydrolase [Pseudooceanicola sp.]MDF1855412.1 MBL fold metallo-hydrolase [Pseudooceanicola sp.]
MVRATLMPAAPISALLALALLCLTAWPAAGQGRDRRLSHCIAIADATPGVTYLHKAAFNDPVPGFSARISYLSHSMFLIQTPGGLSAVTDYDGWIGTADFLPDVVTMNHAHSSHWTPAPDPAIPHVLKGWSNNYGAAADHYLDLGEMLIRNVSTDIRAMGGLGEGGVEENGNSIFVFEVEGLCIGHLGHLHHEPNEEQYAALGRVDVLMAPVDGGMTLDLPSMIRVVTRLKSSVVLPMHWFSDASLHWFIEGVSDAFEVRYPGGSEITLSLRDLPSRPTLIVLDPAPLRAGR